MTTTDIANRSITDLGHEGYFRHMTDKGLSPQAIYLVRSALMDWWKAQSDTKATEKATTRRQIPNAAPADIDRLAANFAERAEALDDPGRRALVQKWAAIRRIAVHYGKKNLVARMAEIDIRRRLHINRDVNGQSRAGKALTPEQTAALRELALKSKKPRWLRPMLLLYMATGARLSELCSLREDNVIHGPSGEIIAVRVLGKGSKWRSIPVCDEECRAHLAAYISESPMIGDDGKGKGASGQNIYRRRGDKGYVFRADRFNAGDFISHQTVSREISRLLEEIGAKTEGLACHALRHTAATLLVEDGTPLDVVQRILGHSNLTTTARFYNHRREESVFAEFARHAQSLSGKTPVQPTLVAASAA